MLDIDLVLNCKRTTVTLKGGRELTFFQYQKRGYVLTSGSNNRYVDHKFQSFTTPREILSALRPGTVSAINGEEITYTGGEWEHFNF